MLVPGGWVLGKGDWEFELFGAGVEVGFEADADADEADGAVSALVGGFEEFGEVIEGEFFEAGALKGGLFKVVEFEFDEDAADGGSVFFAGEAAFEGGEEWGKGLDAVAEGGEVFGVGVFGADAFWDAFGADGAVVDAVAELEQALGPVAEVASEFFGGAALDVVTGVDAEHFHAFLRDGADAGDAGDG